MNNDQLVTARTHEDHLDADGYCACFCELCDDDKFCICPDCQCEVSS